jgi:hypothetical protein
MGSSGPSGSPEAGAFLGAILGKPDPDDNAAFLAAILHENSGDAACRPHFQPGAPACGDLMMGGSTDDWLWTIGVEEGKKAAHKWQSSQTWDTVKNADILRKAMERDHTRFGPGEQAHHVVQSTDPRAAEARALLDKYHLDVNGAENGIKLTRLVHQTSGLQRTEVIDGVTARLVKAAKAAKSWNAARWAVMEELGRIRREIVARRFRYP